MVVPCELWQISFNCELSNWMTMIIELTVAGIFAIIISIIFYRRQKQQSEKLYEFENGPDIEIEDKITAYPARGSFTWNTKTIRDFQGLVEYANTPSERAVGVKINNIGMDDAIIVKYECTIWFYQVDDKTITKNLLPVEDYRSEFCKIKSSTHIRFHLKPKDLDVSHVLRKVLFRIKVTYRGKTTVNFSKSVEIGLSTY